MSDTVTNDFSDESNKYLKENCHEIERVFEKRKCTDINVKLDNSKIMYKLFLLCCDVSRAEENEISQYITRYICAHNALPVQLVQIISESEDLQTCTYAIDILYKLLLNSNVYNDGDRAIIKKNLSSSANFSLLLESMYSMHARFCENTEYREGFPNMHTKLLHMIVTIYEVKKCRKYITNASENTVRFIGQLMTVYYKHKELTIYLLTVLKVLCFKKKNSEILASKRFFDSLCYACKLTQKIFTVALTLKLMSRNASALNWMSRNEKVFNLILDLANYIGKRPVNKRTLMTTLYRMTRNVDGLRILLKNESFNKLFNYFVKNEKPDIFHHRMGTIKAYTILNRTTPKTRLPSSSLNMDLQLPEDEGEESDSGESEQEVDDSEEESQKSNETDEDSDDPDENSEALQYSFKDISNTAGKSLSKMSRYFEELLESHEPCPKLTIFEDIGNLPDINLEERLKYIETRVRNLRSVNRQAYPDVLLLEAESDEHYLNPYTNYFCVDYLAEKLQRAKGISENNFKSRIVYNLDSLYENSNDPPLLPHPETFTPDDKNDKRADSGKTLKFESRFESGNLRSAKQVGEFEYELLLCPDTNSSAGHQWFYFQISNITPGVTYTFNIINFMKMNSQYNYGMQPVLFSVMNYVINRTGWRRAGDNIIYYGNNYTDEIGTKQYRTLSFCITFQYPNDYVYLAYHYPYTYTRLLTKLFPITNHTSKQIYVRVDKLCDTINSTNEIPLLTITAALDHPESLQIPLKRRPLIIVTSRVHPGETNSSWVMEGVINFLLNETDEQAKRVREHFIFKIIPMLNPEGVIYGNTRSGLTGADLNRCWSRPNEFSCPEIYNAKRLMEYTKRELKHPVAVYIDIHGHSRKKFCFFYGCSPKMSWNRKDRKGKDNTQILKLLPQMMQVFNPHVRLSSCRYKIQKKRESTARVVMWREFGIQHSYTLECSYCSGANQQTMNTKILTDVGTSIPVALGIIADRTYNAKECLPSFALDFRNNNPTKSHGKIEENIEDPNSIYDNTQELTIRCDSVNSVEEDSDVSQDKSECFQKCDGF